MKTAYFVNARTVKDDKGTSYAMFGIDAVSDDGVVVNSVVDIFDSFEKAEEFAAKCTVLELSPEHLQDVIEDALIS